MEGTLENTPSLSSTLMVRCFAEGEASNHRQGRDIQGPFEARLRRAPQGEGTSGGHYSAATSGLTAMRLFSCSRCSHSSCQSDGRFETVT